MSQRERKRFFKLIHQARKGGPFLIAGAVLLTKRPGQRLLPDIKSGEIWVSPILAAVSQQIGNASCQIMQGCVAGSMEAVRQLPPACDYVLHQSGQHSGNATSELFSAAGIAKCTGTKPNCGQVCRTTCSMMFSRRRDRPIHLPETDATRIRGIQGSGTSILFPSKPTSVLNTHIPAPLQQRAGMSECPDSSCALNQ